MCSLELNHSQIKFKDFSKIHLNDSDERCGEVFITLSRNLIFHCSICEDNFGSSDYFLDHLAGQHYKYVKDENEIDTDTERSDITLFEDYSLDKEIEDQYSVQDQNDDYEDDDKCEETLEKVEIYIKPKFEQIEEVFLEESYSLRRTNSENSFEELEEINVEKREEVEIEEKTSCTQFFDEETSGTKRNKRPRNNDLRSFSCKECGKAFKTNQKLRRHVAIHSDERKHQCKICGFAFKESTTLYLHERRHSGIKKISCGYCSKMFFTITEANNHRRTHTGERPFVCPTCGKAFSSGAGLSTHAKRHSEPSIKCSYCEKCFPLKAQLKQHMVVHTKEKPYVCHICAARFPRYPSLVRHGKLMHERMKT